MEKINMYGLKMTNFLKKSTLNCLKKRILNILQIHKFHESGLFVGLFAFQNHARDS